jgi:hypothetical protein
MNIIAVDCGRVVDYATFSIFRDRLTQRENTRDQIDIRLPVDLQDIPRTLVRIYELVYLDEMRGVSYPMIAKRLWEVTQNPQIAQDYSIVIDATGVGVAVIDLMRAPPYQLSPVGVTVTAGREITMSDFGYNVPKRDVVTNLELLYQTGRIKVARMKHADTFRDQLKYFTKQTTPTGQPAWGNQSDSIHDDFVMGGALGLWYAEKIMPSTITLPGGKAEEKYDPARHGL